MQHPLTLRRPDGESVPAYTPGLEPGRPGVIILQEWWGITDHIRAVTDRFAQAGYNAIAPDLYHGRLATQADDARALMNGMDFPAAVDQDIAAARDALHARHPHLAAIGFCLGGALAIAAGVRLQGITSAIAFYGIPPEPLAQPANIRIPFQGHYATHDQSVPLEKAEAMEAAMRAAGQTPEMHYYDAGHAFFNDTRADAYHAHDANLAWERMMDFLKKTL